jgi:hypothetical protein
LAVAFAATLAGCATVYNTPGNAPLGEALADNSFGREVPNYEDDVLLALSFSGGGTRAAAFSFGVLSELDRARAGYGHKTLLERVDFVSGVSGGSVTAAYFGLKKRAALDDFRERFLLRNAEEGLNTQISLGNIGRALGGGVNDSQFTNWLDRNLFDGARFDAFREDRRPRVWINASDIYNRAVRVREDQLRRAVQRYPLLPRVRSGRGVGGGAACIRADRAGDLSRRLRKPAAGLARARAPRSERPTFVTLVRGSQCALP